MCKTVSQPEPQTRPHVNCGMEKNLICSISEFLEAKHNAYVPKEKRTKWDSHSTEGVLVGYSETSTGYRILNPSTAKVTTVMLHSTKDQPQIRNLSLFQLFQTLFSHNRLVLLVQMIKVQFQICKIMHKKTNVLILKSILMKWLSQREISQTKKSLL